MICNCTLGLRLDPAKPAALIEFLEKLSRIASAKPSSELLLWLKVGSRVDLLLKLAEALPPDAPGFSRSMFGPSQASAGEVLAAASRKAKRAESCTAYHGNLLKHLDWPGALELIRWIFAGAGDIRGGSGMLTARDIILPGAPEGVKIGLYLRDLTKHSKKQVQANFTLEMSVATDDRAPLKRILRALEEGSGFPWRRARLNFFAPEVAAPSSEDAAHWSACLLFLGDATRRISERLRHQGLRLGDLPQLQIGHSGFRRRMQDLQIGHGIGPVNWKAAVKRFVAQRYPTFAPSSMPLGFDVAERLRDDAELVIGFDGSVRLPGKGYGVWLGFRRKAAPSAGMVFMQPLGCFFDHATNHGGIGWVYATDAELEADLEESGRLLDLALPQWRQACVEWLDSEGAAQPKPGHEYGPLSLHEAVEIAARALGGLNQSMREIIRARVGHGGGPPWLAPRIVRETREVTPGRLTPGWSWEITFADRLRGETVTVSIPYAGHIRFELGAEVWIGDGDVTRFMSKTRIELDPQPEDLLMLPPHQHLDPDPFVAETMAWMKGVADSPRLLAYAEEACGKAFRREHGSAGIRWLLNVELLRDGGMLPYWYFAYTAVGRGVESEMRVSGGEPFIVISQGFGPRHGIRHTDVEPGGALG